ncbi:MAG TPA: o-succinylbenzoate synthase [Dermatophilaceae bacterium]|jgi:o-succinylbenzoate synthase
MTSAPAADLAEVLASLSVVQIPMRVRFRGVTVREAALIRGPKGWGEFAPFPEYDDVESSRWLEAAIEAGWVGWPDPVRGAVQVNATVPAVPAGEVAGVLARYDGCATAKVKVAEVGQRVEDDLDRVAAVRDAMGPAARIRVDANGGWTVAGATDALRRLAAYGLEYAEQPCATVEELAALRVALARNGIDVLVAADESIRRASDPMRVVREEAADVIVVKVAPLGGVRSALAIAGECGLPAVVSSALDTSVGIRAGLALAAALPELPFACGLSTVELLAGDVTNDSLVPRAGSIALRENMIEQSLLDHWQAPADREQWWRERVARCHAHLVEGRAAPGR